MQKRANLAEAEMLADLGGPGSGNWGHKGVQGQRGGSAPGGGYARIGIRKGVSEEEQRQAIEQYRQSPPYQEDAEAQEFRQSVSGKVVETKDPGPGHAFQVTICLYENGVAAVAKPTFSVMGFEQHPEAEVAAYELDRMLGLNMVPTTILSRNESGEDISLQRYVPKAVRGQDAAVARLPDLYSVRMMQHFDSIINNVDRNGGNYLIKPDRSIALIDHGLAFSDYRHKQDFAQRDALIEEQTKILMNTAARGRGKRIQPLKHYLEQLSKVDPEQCAARLREVGIDASHAQER